MSPSKSMSTPSETGSQDSVDGAAAGRYLTPLNLNVPSGDTNLYCFLVSERKTNASVR